MYEVFTLGKMPYGGSTSNSIAAKQIISGIIPERPFYCPSTIYENILSKTWNKVIDFYYLVIYFIDCFLFFFIGTRGTTIF